MTGHVKTGNLTGQELSRLARFREVAEQQLKNLGAAIQEAREEKGWSRSRLGREVHVEEKTVERWEKGTTGGAMESLHLIAEALGKTADQLLAAAAAKSREGVSSAENGTRKSEPEEMLSRLGDLLEGQEDLELAQKKLQATADQILSRLEAQGPPRRRAANDG